MLEKKEVPQWVAETITTAGGTNRFGEPNFRVIWGGNRFHTVGGRFKQVIEVESQIIGQKAAVVTEVVEVRQLLAYHPHRWHMEKWVSPEIYGDPEDWYRDTYDEENKIHRCGDYPSRGDYEHVFFLAECPHMQADDTEWCKLCAVSYGQYIPLEENVHILLQQIRALQLSEGENPIIKRLALLSRENLKRELYRRQVTARVQEALRPKLALQPTSWQPGTGGLCAVPDAKLPLHMNLTKKHLGFSQTEAELKEN